ncbi:MAG: nitroreductase family protein [Candidatus Micrarchaeota archaeon]
MAHATKSLYSAVNDRRSVRNFQGRSIEPDKVAVMIEAAQRAPFSETPYRIVAVKNRERKLALCNAALGQPWVKRADVDFVVLATSSGVPGVMSTAAATAYMDIAAHALGLGSVWVGAFYPDQVGRIVDAEKNEIPVAILCCGYPDPRAREMKTPRRNLSDLIAVIDSSDQIKRYQGIPDQSLGSMPFFDVVARRRAATLLQRTEIEPGKIHRILEVANRAPSAGNLQAYDLLLLDPAWESEGLMDNITDGTSAGAELIIFANRMRSAGKYGERGAYLYCLQDATIAAAYAELAAQDVGLSTRWNTGFDADMLMDIVQPSQHHLPIAILSISK